MTTHLKNTLVAASPWEKATLSINGKKVEWGAELVLLRGQDNDVTVEAPPAIARAINLGLAEGGGLTIVASPNFGDWAAPVNGQFNWKITPDAGKSGLITLSFYSREVPVSWEHRSLVISSNLADEVDVKIHGNPVPALGNWFIRDIPQKVTATLKPGSPIAGLQMALKCTVNSPLIEGDVTSTPAFNTPQTQYEWSVTGHNRSGTFQLSLEVVGMTSITVAQSRLLSKNLADEVDVKINGNVVPAVGNWFIRGTAQKVTVTPKPGSPTAGLPTLAMTLKCTVNSPLVEGDVTSTPALNTSQTQWEWNVTGQNRSGTFQLSLEVRDLNSILLPVSKLLSTNLADEADVKIGGAPVPATGNVFFRGQAQTVTLEPKPNSPLAGYPITLTCAIKSGLDPANVVSAPAFGSEQTAHSWSVTGSTKSGTFQLSLAGKGMTTPITVAVSKLLSKKISDELITELDDSPLPDGELVSLVAGTEHTFTLKPKASSPVGGESVKFDWGTPPTGMEVVINPAPEVFQTVNSVTGASWTLKTGNIAGDFSLIPAFIQEDSDPYEISVSVAVPAEEYKMTFLYAGFPVPPPPYITSFAADTPFFHMVRILNSENKPVKGVTVTFKLPDYDDQNTITSERGLAISQFVQYENEARHTFVAEATDEYSRPLKAEMLMVFVIPLK